jgi:hypothetical protein
MTENVWYSGVILRCMCMLGQYGSRHWQRSPVDGSWRFLFCRYIGLDSYAWVAEDYRVDRSYKQGQNMAAQQQWNVHSVYLY